MLQIKSVQLATKAWSLDTLRDGAVSRGFLCHLLPLYPVAAVLLVNYLTIVFFRHTCLRTLLNDAPVKQTASEASACCFLLLGFPFSSNDHEEHSSTAE